jgi:hypothetical protein
MQRNESNLIVVHCSDTKPSMDHVNEDEIRRWHVEERGWTDAGYNIVIPRQPTDASHGLIEIARPLDEQGAHVAGYNHRAIGVCLVGGMSEEGKPENNFLPEQMQALETVIRFLLKYAPLAVVCGHTDLDSKKTCPNFPVRVWAADLGFPVLGEM